ncbi:helix-turn-helix transcriptional regulator [Vagococcus elongatus]|nr:WYL domain-containing protein [Vagococcus elongatus]
MNSQKRVLTIFIQLLSGVSLTKQDLMNDYKKQSSTIQRDIALIEEVLEEQVRSANKLDLGKLDRKDKGMYQLTQFLESNTLSDNELLAIIKVIYASRAFNKKEIYSLTHKILLLAEDKKRVKHFISNEQLNYQGVSRIDLLAQINFISDAILDNQKIEFEYTKCGVTKTLQRVPTAIHFSDLYFFMLSASHNAQDNGDLSLLNKFRINNIVNPRVISSKNKTPYKERFESGILTNRSAHLPFLGHELTMILDFYWDPVYVLDRFPDSKIIKENEDGSFRIEVQANDGYGVKMWLLSQGDMVKVISPRHLKEYIIQDMIGTLNYYGYETRLKD